MRKTKIVCTLGPATDREGVLREMMLAGMNVARFNFSHGSHAEHGARLDQLKKLREELDLPVAAMLDTRGPEVRLKTFAEGSVTLRSGAEFTLTTEDVVGSESRCAITYAELPGDVKEGDTILLDDGLVRLTVLETTASAIRCRVENDGVMKNNKGVNIPNVRLSMPYMNQRDREDILFGAEQGFDFIAASFVRSAADVREIRRLLDQRDSQIRIIAKIENQEGISNLPEILAVADGVMVARGDLGVEIDFTEIPVIQKQMITFIHRHYAENLSIEDIAVSARVSQVRCRRIFKQYLRQTPLQFLNAYRLEVSGNLLRDTDQTVMEIGERCGYRHKSHFAKAFSKCYGCTPREYRKKYQH